MAVRRPSVPAAQRRGRSIIRGPAFYQYSHDNVTTRTAPPRGATTYDHDRVRPALEGTLRTRPLSHRLQLASDTTAPQRARDFLAAACLGWSARGFTEIGGLVVSELVSNAVRHVGGFVEVSLRLAEDRLTIEVRDEGDGVPAVVPFARRTVGGNGLDIVSRLAETWGVTVNPRGGKSVWCVLAPDA